MVKRDNGHRNADAFMLMWYACERQPDRLVTGPAAKIGEDAGIRLFLSNRIGCGHRELIWNSRDGVTPYGTTCPSCGGHMTHVNFERDMYAPNHVPHRHQKMWAAMTMGRATELAERMAKEAVARGYDAPDVAGLAKGYFRDGEEPMLVTYEGD